MTNGWLEMKSTDQQDLVWLTADEAAQYLKVKTRTLLLWVRQGKIKGHILSGSVRHLWRFRQADLDATLESPSVRPHERMV
jgi:excisionase family DNA binding protein